MLNYKRGNISSDGSIKEKEVKRVIISILVLVVLSVTSCMGNDGAAGKAYLKFTFAWTDATGFLASGFPANVPFDGTVANRFSGSTTNTTTDEYLIASGSSSGTGKWVLYDNYFNSNTGVRTIYFNDTYNYPINGYAYGNGNLSTETVLNYYLSNGYYTYANSYQYTITVNPGEPGGVFWQDGLNGADKHFTITFTWNPANVSIASRNVDASQTRVVDETDTYIVKELTDGNTTFRLKLSKSTSGSLLSAKPSDKGNKTAD